MKSLKKTLVLLVVFSMILSTLVPAFAATDVADLDCEDQVTRMEALGVITGFEDGTFRPNETITRAQMAVIICKMLGINEASAKANEGVASKFSDVAANEWYTGWINIASNNGVIAGFPDGTFRPNETLTLNQVLTLCVKALGRGGYVDKMGTWPANYVTEAARLNLLKDVKGASDANRGTVAVICWNTLNAPTWYVNSENLDGEVSLGQGANAKSLLAINFADFVFENENGKAYLKEAEELTVKYVPSTKTTIGDRQIVLVYDAAKADGWKNFEDVFVTKSGEEKTYYNKTAKEVVVYVPENVYEDIDSLLGKEVTVLFGEDEIASIITVTNDTTFDSAYIEKYNSAKKEVTIDGNDYKFAAEAVVTVNTLELATTNSDAETLMAKLLVNLGETSDEEFEKVVKANAVLNSDEEITRLDIYLSGSFADYRTLEAVATKNKNEELTIQYFTVDIAIDGTRSNATWNKVTLDYEDLSSKQMPKVYKNGESIDITDVKANDILTMYYKTGTNVASLVASDFSIIHVSEETVDGEITKTQKADKKIYVEDTAYTPSMDLYVTDKELTKGGYTSGVVGTDIAKEDEITAYLNIYGEYVVVSTDSEDTGDYTIAYVIATKGADADGDVVTKQIRVLLPDGSKPWYTILAEESDDISFDDVEDLDALKNNVIAFEANGEKEIEIEKTEDIIKIALVDLVGETIENVYVTDTDFDKVYDVTAFSLKNDADELYLSEVTPCVDAYTPDVGHKVTLNGDGKYERDESNGTHTIVEDIDVNDSKNKVNDYRFRAEKTVAIDAKAVSTSKKWNSIIDADKELVGNAVVICKDGETDIDYMFFYSTEDSSSDVMYAVASQIYDDEAVLLTEDGQVTLEYTNAFTVANLGSEKGFVVYKTNSKDKVKDAAMLVDVDAFDKLLSNGEVTTDIVKANGLGVTFVGSLTKDTEKAQKAHFEVDTLDLELLELSFKDEVSDTWDKFSIVDLDEDSIVYDLREDGFVVCNLDEVDLTESAYVITFKNSDCDPLADANILVILD